jgi:DNA helicase-2/ATP-dependent DNA helicase PcrA
LARSVPQATQAVPVFRSGDKVRLLRGEPAKRGAAVLEAVRRIRTDSVNTVAVIGRSAGECAEVHRQLRERGVDATLIDAAQRHYTGGISVLPVHLAKGLEFDAVLLLDVDEAHYGANPQDGRLLYVACTRALHALWVYYEGVISPLVETDDDEVVTVS